MKYQKLLIFLIIAAIVLFFTLDVTSKFQEGKQSLEFCHSKGYDGISDNPGVFSSGYRCFKVVDGFYEYSPALHLEEKE